MTKVEKDTIKDGGIPTEWKPARRAQIDRDGRWTLKRGRKRETPANPSPGGHQRQPEIPRCRCSGTRTTSASAASTVCCGAMLVTHAARCDGSQLGAVLDRDNTASDVWADTAYRSATSLALLERAVG